MCEELRAAIIISDEQECYTMEGQTRYKAMSAGYLEWPRESHSKEMTVVVQDREDKPYSELYERRVMIQLNDEKLVNKPKPQASDTESDMVPKVVHTEFNVYSDAQTLELCSRYTDRFAVLYRDVDSSQKYNKITIAKMYKELLSTNHNHSFLSVSSRPEDTEA